METSTSEGKHGIQWISRMRLDDLDFADDLVRSIIHCSLVGSIVTLYTQAHRPQVITETLKLMKMLKFDVNPNRLWNFFCFSLYSRTIVVSLTQHILSNDEVLKRSLYGQSSSYTKQSSL
ncbi:unnamed protein product [Schistosoma margrebowiei]|uniref:Uncharacterized protein n=1 Tax=Schistosoma margrebowiei TaxID=48269 RepID=A0A183LW86_9TREM|nr:unnamed protein product [Schistosoma margrebowiei]